jgi:hypothetical protein
MNFLFLNMRILLPPCELKNGTNIKRYKREKKKLLSRSAWKKSPIVRFAEKLPFAERPTGISVHFLSRVHAQCQYPPATQLWIWAKNAYTR